MKKKVLIYVQAYNAGRTLSRALKSIQNQTYKNFECIVFDNGSRDNTRIIAEQFSNTDQRFKVLHEDNNDNTVFFHYFIPYIIANYEGKVDLFCNLDSDDEYLPDFLNESIKYMEDKKLDLVACGVEFVDASTLRYLSSRQIPQDMIIEGEEYSNSFPIYHQFMRTMWGKLFAFDLLKEVDCDRCLETCYGGDTLFVFNILENCTRVGIMSKCLHRYYISKKSSSYSFDEKRVKSDEIVDYYTKTFLEKKVGSISIPNQISLMIIYKNALIDTLDVLFKSSESADYKLKTICFMIKRTSTQRLIETRRVSEEFSEPFRKIADWIATQQILVKNYPEEIAKIFVQIEFFPTKIENLDMPSTYELQTLIWKNWKSEDFPLENKRCMLHEVEQHGYFKNISVPFFENYYSLIGKSMQNTQKKLALKEILNIIANNEEIQDDCVDEFIQLGINLSAELEDSKAYIFLKKCYIHFLIEKKEIEKATIELADWNEILPEDPDFKQLRETLK